MAINRITYSVAFLKSVQPFVVQVKKGSIRDIVVVGNLHGKECTLFRCRLTRLPTSNWGLLNIYRQDRPRTYRGVSQENYLHEQFTSLDVDKNGILTLDELRPWLLPSLKAAAKSEATRLMNLTDSNRDGKLTLEEILAKSHSWKDSQVVKHARSLWDEL